MLTRSRTPLVLAALAASWLTPPGARADDLSVYLRLPAERRAEITAALRLELAGRASVLEGAPVSEEVTLDSIREEARSGGATHALWVIFPGSLLAPAEVRVLDVARSSAVHVMTPQAWDIVDPRVVAVLAASLIDPDTAVPVPPPPEPVAPPLVVVEPPSTPTTAQPPASPAPLAAEPSRRARTFSLLLAPLGIAHATPPGGSTSMAVSGHLALYGRVSEWASLGLRLRGGGGYSSIQGAMVDLTLGLPSIAISFRELLGTAAAIELGVHAEGGLHIDASERVASDRLLFGLGVGAFVTVELGAANGLQLDYTLDVFGFGDRGASTNGSLSLAYVHRWD